MKRRFAAGPPPLALYVHWPWCLRKCPYCDFNSHPLSAQRASLQPQAAYVDALLADLDAELVWQPVTQPVETLFIGGGTPSLLAGSELARLLEGIRARLDLSAEAELTLEANPGAVDAQVFTQALAAGINRLSLGIQSLSDSKLHTLGRLHDAKQARQAVAAARQAGCRNLNLDLMFGLPGQTLAEARKDLQAVLALQPEHLSYYQLTLELDTAFARQPPSPPLPEDDVLAEMAEQGQRQLAASGYRHYEVSAYARLSQVCRHNLNYWTFGDYLGLGAGAHGKRTDITTGQVWRRAKWSDPPRYLSASQASQRDPMALLADSHTLHESDLVLEFALNALRLHDGVPLSLFECHTGLPSTRLAAACAHAQQQGLLERSATHLRATALGQRFLNQLLECFALD
ncbi:YggW family oxidoreductase [Rhabdochromatium marinum]|nr:YggW family oxidoreductase [Rhabdochromatium marinum]